MILLHNYRIHSRNNKYYVIPQETRVCPICQGELRPRDVKRRKAIEASGEVRIYALKRLKCQTCGSTHLELPDILVPHKHYTRHAIEMALFDPASACSAETSTIYRWNREHLCKQAARHNESPGE